MLRKKGEIKVAIAVEIVGKWARAQQCRLFHAAHGLLYIMEPLTDEEHSIIHVWRVNP